MLYGRLFAVRGKPLEVAEEMLLAVDNGSVFSQATVTSSPVRDDLARSSVSTDDSTDGYGPILAAVLSLFLLAAVLSLFLFRLLQIYNREVFKGAVFAVAQLIDASLRISLSGWIWMSIISLWAISMLV
jgi:hypothetical protein